MAYLGLVPSEHSSGASVKRGGLTKAGNSAARRLLIEASWTYRFPARVSRELLLRQEEQPKPIREIAWKAQLRLCARYRKLARSGKPANVVTAAIARELADITKNASVESRGFCRWAGPRHAFLRWPVVDRPSILLVVDSPRPAGREHRVRTSERRRGSAVFLACFGKRTVEIH
jgi:hypothetical protein